MENNIEKKEGWIEKLIGFSAAHKYLVLLCVFIALIGAVWSIQNIPLNYSCQKMRELMATILKYLWSRNSDIF